MVVVLLVKKKDNVSSTLAAEIIDADTRDNYLFILNDAINYLHHKAVNGKVRNPKTEKVKIDYFRALIYAVNTANAVYKDKQLDKLESDLEKLKKGLILPAADDDKSGEISDEKLNELIGFDEKIKELRDKGD